MLRTLLTTAIIATSSVGGASSASAADACMEIDVREAPSRMAASAAPKAEPTPAPLRAPGPERVLWCDPGDDPRCAPIHEGPTGPNPLIASATAPGAASDATMLFRAGMTALTPWPDATELPPDGVRRRVDRPPQTNRRARA